MRVWELDIKILVHLKEQLEQVKKEREEAEKEQEKSHSDVRPPSPASQHHHKPSVTFNDINTFKNRDEVTSKMSRKTKLVKGGQLDEVLGIAVCPITLCEEFLAHTTSTFNLHIVYLDKSDIQPDDEVISLASPQAEFVDRESARGDSDGDENDGKNQPAPPDAESSSTIGGRRKRALELLQRQRDEATRPDPTNYKTNPYRTQSTWQSLFKRDEGVKKATVENLFLQNFYLISSTLMGESMMWTLSGVFIGQFGGKTAGRWDLQKPESWPNRWLIDNDNEEEDEVERAKREKMKEERPMLSTKTTLEMEVEKALDTSKLRVGRKLTSEELNASVMKKLHERSIKPPVSVQHSDTYRRLTKAHPLVPTESLPFDSTRVTRMDV